MNTHSSKPTLVLGGTGKTGRRVVERLTERGLPVRVGSRSGKPPFDWEDDSTWPPAIEGVGAVYVSYYPDLAVPGAVEAWAAILDAYGRFGLDRALAPAIRYAERGFPVAQRIASDWARAVAMLGADPGAARHYLPAGRPPAEGDVVKLPALAATLKTIAAEGARAFYRGPIARAIARALETAP